MERILITGADGFLGSHLTDFYINRNASIFALKRPDQAITCLYHYTKGKKIFNKEEKLNFVGQNIQIPSTNENLTILECDIKNKVLLEKIIEKVNPNIIFHFAAQPYVIPSWQNPVDTIETNVIGTINVFEPIKKFRLNTKVIVACSSAEYGTTTKLKRALKENDPILAIHPYGISKIATELLARQYYINFKIPAVITRFFNQTGPRKTNDACSDFAQKIAKIELGLEKPIIHVGNLSTYRDFLGFKDSVNAIWLIATKGALGETYNVCSSMKTKIQDILNTILSFSQKKIKVIENTPEMLRKTDEDIILGNNSKLKELGFEVTQPIQDVLKEMYDYWITIYREENR